MKIITGELDHKADIDIPPRALFFDIETTGLSPLRAQIYLIGCVRESGGRLIMTQWLDETGREEEQILRAFLAQTAPDDVLIHFNGDRFDLPFVAKRASLYGIDDPLGSLPAIDLYRGIRPYKNLLGFPDYRQQTLEKFFDSGREEHMSGGDLIPVYLTYAKTGRADCRDMVLSHNRADLQGLISLLPLRAYAELSAAEADVTKVRLEDYSDHEGNVRQELLVSFRLHTAPLPEPLAFSYEGCYLRVRGNTGLLKAPVCEEEMKLFHADWRNYYYVPEMDEAVHRSVASFLDPSRRMKASVTTAYTKRRGLFLPQFSFPGTKKRPALPPVCENIFLRSYGDTQFFLELTDEARKDKAFFDRYATHVLRAILMKRTLP